MNSLIEDKVPVILDCRFEIKATGKCSVSNLRIKCPAPSKGTVAGTPVFPDFSIGTISKEGFKPDSDLIQEYAGSHEHGPGAYCGRGGCGKMHRLTDELLAELLRRAEEHFQPK